MCSKLCLDFCLKTFPISCPGSALLGSAGQTSLLGSWKFACISQARTELPNIQLGFTQLQRGERTDRGTIITVSQCIVNSQCTASKNRIIFTTFYWGQGIRGPLMRWDTFSLFPVAQNKSSDKILSSLLSLCYIIEKKMWEFLSGHVGLFNI